MENLRFTSDTPAGSHGRTLPGPTGATVRWVDSVLFMIVNDFGDRYRHSKLSAFFTVFEPLSLIAMLSIAQVVIGGGSLWSDALFHTTGILPYYLFFHITLRVRAQEAFRLPPRVTFFDQMLSHCISEVLAKAAIGVVLFSFLASMGVTDAVPFDPAAMVTPVLLICVMGVGAGLINVFITSFFGGWPYIWAIVARAMMGLAGLLTRPDQMPLSLQNFVAWNPLFQVVTWFRTGCYPGYPTALLHKGYFMVSAFVILGVGVVLDQSLREYRYSR